MQSKHVDFIHFMYFCLSSPAEKFVCGCSLWHTQHSNFSRHARHRKLASSSFVFGHKCEGSAAVCELHSGLPQGGFAHARHLHSSDQCFRFTNWLVSLISSHKRHICSSIPTLQRVHTAQAPEINILLILVEISAADSTPSKEGFSN